ncbi:type IV toxin-antitoxin system AbiEi family antitoxin domain-containing protein [Fodinicurvata fenggangensis]|uniref:type IV toxin-antitoxin system AbiEi family antitoxin domain-containing protein n=1 Tax=Fodinicurvata fenggangensis TaxID=1121830 RepID=UPI00047BBD6F|nr:hypothetical protein [Fodinicurvata fenggangensis]
MNFNDAFKQALFERDLPIITYYELFLLGYELFSKGSWKGDRLKYMPKAWDLTRTSRALGRLKRTKVLTRDSDFRSNVWRVIEATRAGSAEEVACLADPFAYVSHLSAMQRYNLTNRSPKALHITRPTHKLWTQLRDKKIQKDMPHIPTTERPPLVRPGFNSTIRRRPVVLHESSHPAMPIAISGEQTRITSIGRTFADMLTEPELCGGMRHVLEVWEREVEAWIPEIVEAVDQLDSKIAKVRAGYILSEVMDISHPVIHNWEQYAQRGGSRKLDPEADYAPVFSEKWMISLNA